MKELMKNIMGIESQKTPETKMGKDSSSMKNSEIRRTRPIGTQNQDARIESPQHPKRERRRCEPDSVRFYVNSNVHGDSSTSNENMIYHIGVKFR